MTDLSWYCRNEFHDPGPDDSTCRDCGKTGVARLDTHRPATPYLLDEDDE